MNAMIKISIAFATLAAVIATSGSALANDAVGALAYPTTSASPRADHAQRPAKTYVLDFMSTQSIVRTDKSASEAKPEPAGAPSGIDVNPWIVPSFR
jgi:hypothetical protein